MVRGRVGQVLASLALAGCAEPVFICADDGDCRASQGNGLCEDTQYCSFPDDACESGSRYGDLAGEDLAGKCVQGLPGESSDGSGGSSSAPASCGNGTLEDGEVCDGNDFGDLDCVALGFAEGELQCVDDCSEVSTHLCPPAACRHKDEPCSGPADCCNSGCGKNGSVCITNNVEVCCT